VVGEVDGRTAFRRHNRHSRVGAPAGCVRRPGVVEDKWCALVAALHGEHACKPRCNVSSSWMVSASLVSFASQILKKREILGKNVFFSKKASTRVKGLLSQNKIHTTELITLCYNPMNFKVNKVP
jgi:hypothetical protein